MGKGSNQDSQEQTPLIFYVNGKKVVDYHADPSVSLLTYLRKNLRLCGTKRGCNEGACGSCTVMVSKLDQKSGKIRHYSINACLASIGTMHGLAVTTVEGVGSTKTRLHPVQERIAKAHGTQCGFCTPGFVMSMYTLLRNNPEPTMEEIEENLVGNLCRCTGYRPILEGFRTFAKESGCGKENCCRLNNIENGECNKQRKDLEQTAVLHDPMSFSPYDPSQDIIFPPDLQMESPKLQSQSFLLTGGNILFHKVVSLPELLQLKRDYPEASVVAGNTMKAFSWKTESETPSRILYCADIPDLKNMEITDNYVEMGASLSISDVEEQVKLIVKRGPESRIQNFRSMMEMLPWFADRQIKNVASLGGNVMSYFSISDFNCILMASEATLIFKNKDNERKIKADGEFFQKKNVIVKSDEVLVAICIPFIKENEFFKSLKHSKRRGKDLSIVNAAMKVTLEFPSLKISSMIISVGGASRSTIMAENTMAKVVGQTWDETFLDKGISLLIEEMKTKLVSASYRSPDYKTSLIAGFFFRFYLYVCEEIHKKFPKLGSPLKLDESDIILPFRNKCTKSMQFFQDVPDGQEKIDPVGRPVPHVSGLKQTTGEAIYVDDLPSFENELHAALVLSEKAHAKIVSIDPSEALKMEGVEGFFSAKDISDIQNKTGFVELDEEVFASSEVQFVGQIIGVVVAEDQKQARLAAKKVSVKYEEFPNAVLSIEKAIVENSVWEPLCIQKGNIEKGFENSKHILEGESRAGGQKHLYLETNGHIVIPSEDGEVEVIGAMQAPSTMQKLIAKLLEVDINRVTCKTKRMGGAFGGKTSRSIQYALPTALAAVKLQRPVRIILTRSEDMMITGGRHPILAKWKIGFGDDGQLHALDIKYYLNCGYAIDFSEAVLEKIVFHADNVYKIGNLNIWGQCCKTNMTPNTSFRALAMPHVIFVIENIVSQVADYLHMSSREIREKNMYPKTKYTTPFGQELTRITVRECWDQVISSCNFEEKKKAIEIFNRHNRYKKRGIAVTPFKYPIGFSLPTLCQGAALIHVYLDGSVLLSHGGVEYGQGLHTKMLQVASRALKIPISKIYIAETSTDKVPNTSNTAASAASDLSGMAVLNACTKISTRLAPYRNQRTWEEAVTAAYMDRVSLSATGFYIIPGVTQYDFKEGKPASPYSYYSYGASVSEVEINCLTGEHTVLRADIVMDAGKSLNPGIDIGQIEGAFAQGYGLFTLEQLIYSDSGELITKGPNAYKLPCVMNIPREFNVTLLRDSVEERAVYSSKATGEPSVLAGVSVFLAIREAVKAARKEDQLTIPLHSPATSETIRMACEDWITCKVSNINNK